MLARRPRPSLVRLPTAAGALIALAGCSIALDFDRSFPTQGVFPAAYLKAPNPGEAPYEKGLARDTACGDFCEAYIGCLGQKDVCHFIWSLPDDSEVLCREPGVPGKRDLITTCTSDCGAAGTLTPSQLKAVQNAGECRELAMAVKNDDPTACTPLQEECKALCNPPAGQASLSSCDGLPGLNERNCIAVCENQSYLFFECVNCQPTAEQGLCASALTCKKDYYQALGVDREVK